MDQNPGCASAARTPGVLIVVVLVTDTPGVPLFGTTGV